MTTTTNPARISRLLCGAREDLARGEARRCLPDAAKATPIALERFDTELARRRAVVATYERMLSAVEVAA
jgi:hypothetical protein